ncbi:MAG: secretin and TonB N-terminal domain-containing protein [Candidatus Omnitrophota bacterium]
MGNKFSRNIFILSLIISGIFSLNNIAAQTVEEPFATEVFSQEAPVQNDHDLTDTLDEQLPPEPEELLNIEKISKAANLYNIELREVTLKDFLRILAFRHKLNILVDEDVQGRITASFNNIDLEEALSAILKMHGFRFKKEGNIIRVSRAMVTEIIRLNYIQVEALLGITSTTATAEMAEEPQVTAPVAVTAASTASAGGIYDLLSSSGKIFPGTEPNTMMIVDYLENIEKIKEYIKMIDIQPQQVIIDARVVEITLDDTDYLTINIDWLSPSQFTLFNAEKSWDLNLPYKGNISDGSFSFGLVNSSIDATIQALSLHIDTDLLSAPRIATMNKKKAVIEIVEEVPYLEEESSVTSEGGTEVTKTIAWKYVGIKLDVTPTINPDGTITMHIKPEVNELVAWSRELPEWTASDPNAPVVDTRSVETNITVYDGQTIILGGLVKNKFDLNITKVPLLGDIPILGHLFRSKKYVKIKKELLIFVEPRIISSEVAREMMLENRYGVGERHRIEKERKQRHIEENYLEEQYKKQRDEEYQQKTHLKDISARTDITIDKESGVLHYPDYYEKAEGKRGAENEALRRAKRILEFRKKISRDKSSEYSLHEGYKKIKGTMEYLADEEFKKIDEAMEIIEERYSP